MKRFRAKRPKLSFTIDQDVYEGESMESKVEKIIAGKEPIELTRSLEYQERRAGVAPEYNIRTDIHEIRREAVEEATGNYFEARKMRQNARKPLEEKSDEAEPTRTGANAGE